MRCTIYRCCILVHICPSHNIFVGSHRPISKPRRRFKSGSSGGSSKSSSGTPKTKDKEESARAWTNRDFEEYAEDEAGADKVNYRSEMPSTKNKNPIDPPEITGFLGRVNKKESNKLAKRFDAWWAEKHDAACADLKTKVSEYNDKDFSDWFIQNHGDLAETRAMPSAKTANFHADRCDENNECAGVGNIVHIIKNAPMAIKTLISVKTLISEQTTFLSDSADDPGSGTLSAIC